MGHQKKKLSDFDENGTNRLETIKSGANLSSDQKVIFFEKLIICGWCAPCLHSHPQPLMQHVTKEGNFA